MSPGSNGMVVVFRQGAYSKEFSFAPVQGATQGFFRMYSPDDEPTNAVIQHAEAPTGVWTNVALP